MDNYERRRFLKVSPLSPCSCSFGIFYPGNYFSIPHRIRRRDEKDIIIPSMVSKSDIVNCKSYKRLTKLLSRRYRLTPVEEVNHIFFIPKR